MFIPKDITSLYSPLGRSSSLRRDHNFATSETQFDSPKGQSHPPVLKRTLVLSTNTKLYPVSRLRHYLLSIYSTQKLQWPHDSSSGWYWFSLSLFMKKSKICHRDHSRRTKMYPNFERFSTVHIFKCRLPRIHFNIIARCKPKLSNVLHTSAGLLSVPFAL